MTAGDIAEARIASLGITEASMLDVEAIAWEAGMRVSYEELHGCDATLVGYGDKAIATVRRTVQGRERFSVGHELGHWEMHRGQSFKCRVDDPSTNLASDRVKEKVADSYSAHLLMPAFLFNPVIKNLKYPGFSELREVAAEFKTTLLATAIRLVDVNKLPAIIACYTGDGKMRWHARAGDIPKRWWLHQMLDEDSFANELIRDGTEHPKPRKQSADAWFANDDAEDYELLEHATQLRGGDVLVLLYLTDGEMLDAGYDPNLKRTR